jgi:hypothetical protein
MFDVSAACALQQQPVHAHRNMTESRVALLDVACRYACTMCALEASLDHIFAAQHIDSRYLLLAAAGVMEGAPSRCCRQYQHQHSRCYWLTTKGSNPFAAKSATMYAYTFSVAAVHAAHAG